LIRLAQNQARKSRIASGPFRGVRDGLGQFGSKDLTTSEKGYSFNNAGFVAGADYRVTPRFGRGGLAFGYTRTNTSFDTSAVFLPNQFLHDNSFTGNVYATRRVTDALYMNAIAAGRRRQQQLPTPYRHTQHQSQQWFAVSRSDRDRQLRHPDSRGERL